ncbi:hypothetical protein ACI789_02560 [Geodermatophilus sp. SYSU D00965]
MNIYFHNSTCSSEPERSTGTDVEEWDFWNLWQRRLSPWAELSEGDHVILVESWPGGCRLSWEVEVTGLIRGTFNRVAEAVRPIAEFHALSEADVWSDPYTADKPDEPGVYLAWHAKPVRELYVSRPAALRMRQHGWAVVDDEIVHSWGLDAPGHEVASAATRDIRDAVQVLTGLVGRELATARRGRWNRILSLEPPNVVVGTEKSPEGQPVPIAWVDNGLQLLRRHGAVTVNVETLGHRSSFIGAVLATLPGVSVAGSPPVVSLPEYDDAGTPWPFEAFEGDTSLRRMVETRREQRPLRALLFGQRETGTCALCGQEYPVSLLVAAHIKPRRACSEDERRQLSRIAMPACLFGCDALFEAGYVGVDGQGRIMTANSVPAGSALSRQAERLTGRTCAAFNKATADFFQWHRENSLRKSPVSAEETPLTPR